MKGFEDKKSKDRWWCWFEVVLVELEDKDILAGTGDMRGTRQSEPEVPAGEAE